jgi:hypothetical protein
MDSKKTSRKGDPMAEQKLQKLSRKELLELMIAQGKVLEETQAELAEANRKLAERDLELENVGSLAEAAQIYLHNIQKKSQEQDEALARVKAKEAELQSKLDHISDREPILRRVQERRQQNEKS